MLPVNKKQLQNPDNHNLDFAVVFFILSDDCYSEMVANMHAPMTRMAVIIILKSATYRV